MGLPRFHVSAEELSGSRIELDRTALDHLKARRVRPGDLISLFDGRGGEALGRVARIERSGAAVDIAQRLPAAPGPALRTTLALGVCRWERLRLAVEKATELGASFVQPVISERSQPAPKGLTDKLQRIVIESLKQCRRSAGPEILEPIGLAEFLAEPGDHDLKLLLDGRGGRLREQGLARPARVLLLAGPEGGLSEEEREAALAAGFVPIALAQAVLRVETAVLAGLAVVSALWEKTQGQETDPGGKG